MNAFDVVEGMLILEREGKGIKSFFEDNEVHTVGMYGFGRIGQLAYQELIKAGVTVKYIFDKNADYIEAEGLCVISPETSNLENDIELIIVTPMEYYFDIKEELEVKTSVGIISIGEIVEYCMEGEDYKRGRRFI